MNAISGKDKGDRRVDVLRGIGDSLLSCPGADLKTALRYYEQAESIVNDISKCKAKKHQGHQFYGTICIDKLIENAMNQKKAGDSYMGCSPEYIKTVEMEERIICQY